MEEDIKLLEEKIDKMKTGIKVYRANQYIDLANIMEREKQALENLIKRYRELEKKNKYWNDRIEYAKNDTKGLKMYEMGMAWEDMKEDLENSIPKSKIKEKIEEIKSRMNDDCIALHEFQRLAKIEVLQELMEDK